jgi:formylglycine-generating enzyme required for sulfatase activity
MTGSAAKILIIILTLAGVRGVSAADIGAEVVAGIRMVSIPAGRFVMGTYRADDPWLTNSRPVLLVEVGSFQLSATEITQAQYQQVTGRNPSLMMGEENRPAEQVSWYDAITFCNMLSEKAGLEPCYDLESESCDCTKSGFRLPAEREWEYACRAGTTTSFCTGSTQRSIMRTGWFSGNAEGTTHPVARKQPNAWGLYDMHGNVWEWCDDLFRSYDQRLKRVANRLIQSRVIRGGGWHSPPDNCASAYRHRARPDFCLSMVGFRIARSITE